MPATVVTLRDGDYIGRGEAAGVYYNDDHPEAMLATLEALRPRIEAGLDRETLRTLLPAGGARNALDCALSELRSAQHTSELQSLMRISYAVFLFTKNTTTDSHTLLPHTISHH